jgi:hypothetical protein
VKLIVSSGAEPQAQLPSTSEAARGKKGVIPYSQQGLPDAPVYVLRAVPTAAGGLPSGFAVKWTAADGSELQKSSQQLDFTLPPALFPAPGETLELRAVVTDAAGKDAEEGPIVIVLSRPPAPVLVRH